MRRTLSTGSPLVAGSERLAIETGTISVELIDKKPVGNSTYDLTLREVAEYPYVGEPAEDAMGEAYERHVRMQANGPTWLSVVRGEQEVRVVAAWELVALL